MTKHFNITISGLVQGVFFRDGAKEIADKIGVFGFVQNTDAGTVYVEVEGEEKKLEEFIAWCHTGPKLARVEKVEITEGPLSHFTHFEVRFS
jgi:acylphosphatase